MKGSKRKKISQRPQVPTNPPGKLCTRLFGEETTNYEQLGGKKQRFLHQRRGRTPFLGDL